MGPALSTRRTRMPWSSPSTDCAEKYGANLDMLHEDQNWCVNQPREKVRWRIALRAPRIWAVIEAFDASRPPQGELH
jgi:hypothetical protein